MSVCPQCGGPLPKTVLRGLCPRCTVHACLESAGAFEAIAEGQPSEPEETAESSRSDAMPDRFFGGYELLDELGRGGMGVVYRARQLNARREVALKMVAPQRLVSPQDVQRFKLEAETAAHLDHPNILPIYDVGECQGQPYYTMKLVRGGSLAGRLSEFPIRTGSSASADRAVEKRRRAGAVQDLAEFGRASSIAPASWSAARLRRFASFVSSRPDQRSSGIEPKTHWRARQQRIVSLFLKIARAVAYAHQRGILHRDLKPANILFDEKGEPYVADFGLAKWVERDTGLTQTLAFVGTPGYAAPEQVQPRPSGLTMAADVYSLGAILYELLTGCPPFKGPTTLETLRQVIEDPVPPPHRLNPGIDRDLETLCLKCLEKDPQRRYASAADLADDLERFDRGEPVLARPVSALGRLRRWSRRKPALAAMTGALTLAVFSVVVVAVSATLRVAREREAAQIEAYYSAIGLANAHIKDGKIQQALEVLWKCPERYRQWEWGRLLYLCHQDVVSWQAHSNAVVQLEFDPSGQYLLSRDDKGLAKVWDWMEERLWFSLGDATNRVFAAAFNPTGELVVSTTDGQVRVWRLETRPPDHETIQNPAALEGLRNDRGSPGANVLSPVRNDHAQVTANREPQPSTFEESNAALYCYKPALELTHRHDPIRTIVISPEGRWLAGSDESQTVHVWNGETAAAVLTLTNCPGPIVSLAFGSQGDTLAVGSASKVSWRTIPSGLEVRGFAAPDPDSRVFADPTGTMYAVIDSADRLELWRDGRPVCQFGTLRRSPPQQPPRVFFSPRGKWLCAAGHNNTARVWSTETGEEQLAMPDRVYEARFSPDERFMVTIGLSDGASIWDLEKCRRYRQARGHEQSVGSVTLRRDGEYLATGDDSGLVKVWSAKPGRERIETDAWLHGGRYSPDGRLLVAAPTGLGILVFEADSGHLRQHIRLPGEAFCWFNFSPNGRYLAAADANKAALVFNLETGVVAHRLAGHHRQLQTVAYSRDGTEIATGSLDGTVKLWDAETGGELSTFAAHTNGVLQLVFTRDGKRLITSGNDHYVRLWHRSTLRILAEHWLGATTIGWGLDCSQDGRFVAVACSKGSFSVLSAESLKHTDTPLVRGGNWDLSWSQDSQRLITATTRGFGYGRDHGSVELWSFMDRREVLTVADCDEVVTSVACQPHGLRLASTSMDFALYQWEAFPWDRRTYDRFDGETIPQRVRRYARAYWIERLAAENCPPPPVREIELPFDHRFVPQRDPAAPPAQVDLTRHYTGLLCDPIYPPFNQDLQDNDLSNLPSGLIKLGGVTFDVRGVIRLRANHPKGRPWTLIWGEYPAKVESIQIGRVFHQMHVLHGTAGGWMHALGGARHPVPEGTPIARFTCHYADGSRHSEEVVYGRDVRDWWEGAVDKGETERSEVVWRGANPVADHYGARLRLYRTPWTHPHPERVVMHLDYESLLTACGPFLVALTVE